MLPRDTIFIKDSQESFEVAGSHGVTNLLEKFPYINPNISVCLDFHVLFSYLTQTWIFQST